MNFRKYRNLINNTKVTINDLPVFDPAILKITHVMDIDCILNTFVIATENTNISNGVQRLDVYWLGKWYSNRRSYQFWEIEDASESGKIK